MDLLKVGPVYSHEDRIDCRALEILERAVREYVGLRSDRSIADNRIK